MEIGKGWVGLFYLNDLFFIINAAPFEQSNFLGFNMSKEHIGLLENKYKLIIFINVQKTFNPTEVFLMEISSQRSKTHAFNVV